MDQPWARRRWPPPARLGPIRRPWPGHPRPRPRPVTTWRTRSPIGNLLQHGQADGSGGRVRRTLEINAKLAADYPAVAEYRHQLAASHINVGVTAEAHGQAARGGGRVPHGRSPEKLAADNPAVTEFRNGLAISYLNLGGLL